MSEFAGVVLAAGLGTRLRPLTDIRPKALCPVANRPLVDLAIDRVRNTTPDVAVNVHHHRERMVEHLSPLGVNISVEHDQPLGTAGALGKLRNWIDGRPAMVHNADAWFGTDDVIDALTDGWDGERIRLLVVPARPGYDDFDDATFAGISLLPWSDVRALEPVPSGLWEASWRAAYDGRRVELLRCNGPWYDTGTPSTYLAANLAACAGDSVIAPDADVHADSEVVRSLVWPEAEVRAGERLVEQIRAPGPITVDAPQS